MVAVTTASTDPDPTDVDLLGDDRLLDLRPRARRTDAAAVIDEERRRTAPPPAANQALREWADTAAAPATSTGGAANLGLCALCGTKPARSACRNCGRSACTADLWSMLGLCKSCVKDSRGGTI